jgi:cyclopropane fatty-acyl-phospholipid synthase-like methyltransferase
MHTFNAEQTARFFDQTFFRDATPQLRHRDHLLMQAVLKPLLLYNPRIIDFGCGPGWLLHHMIKAGFDAVGMEKHNEVYRSAESLLASIDKQDCIVQGGVEEFSEFEPESFDIVVAMGVLQYLSEAEYEVILKAVARVLRPNGCFVATFQNALFDLYTFNKYTIDFLMHQLVGPLLSPGQWDRVKAAISTLVVNSERPDYSPTRARDNVFVRLTNPLTLAEDIGRYGMRLEKKYFYEWFGLPPLVGDIDGISQAVTARFELRDATAWQGHFMANAFLAEFKAN